MSGNVWKWTRSLSTRYPYDPTDGREDLKTAGGRVVRGESFGFVEKFGRAASRPGYPPATRDESTGFRVVVSHF